jgi:flagella basal body P-ring formation protein FlgA
LGDACAATLQDARQIEQVVANFAAASSRALPGRVEISVGTIDPRLALTQCAMPEAFVPAGTRLWGTTNVGVRCRTPAVWTLYVPVTVRVFDKVLLAARPLDRGKLIEQHDLLMQERDLTLFAAGTVSNLDHVVGKVLRNPLGAGMPVRADFLRGEYLVTPGQPVKLVCRINGLIVTSEGKSLGNAAHLDGVSVRAYGGQIRRGVVTAAGVVEIM